VDRVGEETLLGLLSRGGGGGDLEDRDEERRGGEEGKGKGIKG
jgi:hypothetical protein